MSDAGAARALLAEALNLPVDTIPPGGDMFTIAGWDSLGHVRLILAVEARLGRPLAPQESLSLTSVAAVAACLAGGGAAAS